MRQNTLITIPTLLLFVCIILSSVVIANNASAESSRDQEVVILMCGTRFDLNPPVMSVMASSSSSNAPTVSFGTVCAQALSDILGQGFRIKDVQPTFGDGALYTLINK